MKKPDLIIAAALASLSVAIIATAWNFPKLAGLSVGPGLFPIVLGFALLGCTALLAFNATMPSVSKKEAPEAPQKHEQAGIRVFAVLAACALFAGLGSDLGFVIVGIVSIAGLMLAFGVALRRAVLVSVVSVILLDLFFVKVMRIPLPLGVLAPFAGWL
ncbi:MAG: tripartite tricarboxylate transporter TctB family protein [Rhabdaerophilum sp.]